MATDKQTQSRIKEITQQLEAGIKDVFSGDKFAAYLKTMSKFHRYSIRNTVLIHMQMPTATKLAGFTGWKNNFERYVKKGEKGIYILAPIVSKAKKEMEKLDPDTQKPLLDKNGDVILEEVEVTIPRYKTVAVFDISQTDGKPLPSLMEDLTGDVRQYEAFMDALKQISPLPISFEPMKSSRDGYCRYGKQIAIREGMSEIQTVCAAIHEITHATLHDKNASPDGEVSASQKGKQNKEVTAESVSYVVCQYYGIETGANSFGYVAGWSSDMTTPELKASLDTIRTTAAVLIERIDKTFKEITQERGIVVAVDNPVSETSAPSVEELATGHTIPSVETLDSNPAPLPVAPSTPGPPTSPVAPSAVEQPEPVITDTAQQSPPNSHTVNEPPLSVEPSVSEQTPGIESASPAQTNEPANEGAAFGGILPDPAIGVSERDLYGYTFTGILPLRQERAIDFFDNDHTVTPFLRCTRTIPKP